MAAASIAKHLQFDYLTHTDPFRALQGFEALEQAFLEPETQMEFGGTPNSNNTVEVSNGGIDRQRMPSSYTDPGSRVCLCRKTS